MILLELRCSMKELMKKLKEEQLLKEQSLSKYASLSKDYIRLTKEPDDDLRTSYFRDIDRIIHSRAYSRYIDKTQVFIETNNDHITHRIIHVALVAKIAKTIGRALNLNEDLIEAIALGHDIGHSPFGHLGESFLNDICIKENIGFFSHNIQSVKTFMILEKNGLGLNLCIQTLDGIMCHNGEILNNVYKPKQKTKEDFLNEYELSYTNKEVLKTLRPMTLEGCVVRISDIIGYIGRDIEDAIHLDKLNRSDIPLTITNVLGNNNRDIVNTIILDVIHNSYDKPYIKMSKEVFNAIKALKEYNYEYIYKNAYTEAKKTEYKDMFYKLFEFYKQAYLNNDKTVDIVVHYQKEMTNDYNDTIYSRIIVDFLAGATDDFLINQYNKYILKESHFVDKYKKR